MVYDWHAIIRVAEQSREFFEEIDRRFIMDRFFAKDGVVVPFAHLIPIPSSQAKKALLRIIPNKLAQLLLSKVGNFIFIEADK